MNIEEQFEALARGAVEIVPRESLLEKLRQSQASGRPLQIKLGLDPTAPDIHLGNAVVLRKLRQFQDAGHEVTVIIGDFTAMIGDPTGRSEARKQLSPEQVSANAKTYADQYHKILDPAKTKVVFNSDWLGKLNLYDIVKLMAKTTVARILERDDFTNRFNNGLPIHAHELLYPLCQGYDSVVLKSDVEIGGTEQKFNILMGRDLQREDGVAVPQVGLFMPLLVGLDGIDKMSKSKGNAVGIDEPPLTMFEKLMSISDTMMTQYYELCTDVPLADVALLCDAGKTHPKLAKKRLAREIVSIYHGADAAQAADAEWEHIHAERELPDDIPEFVVPAELLASGPVRIVQIAIAAGLAATGGEAKRLVQQGGISFNGEKVKDTAATIEITNGDILSSGRRRFVKLVRK
ncbi:MAG: tyrosine--tRNA ligase [Capsulimonadaceae bacterium]|nr:tyrosine--tRNA ligase [Capsulimonadaceae bacterium]